MVKMTKDIHRRLAVTESLFKPDSDHKMDQLLKHLNDTLHEER